MSAVSMQKAMNLAEYALAEREALRGGDLRTEFRADLRCCAAGLLLLAELGARRLEPCDGHRIAVEIGKDAIAGWRMVEHHADLLRRLGWVRGESWTRASFSASLDDVLDMSRIIGDALVAGGSLSPEAEARGTAETAQCWPRPKGDAMPVEHARGMVRGKFCDRRCERVTAGQCRRQHA